MTPRTGSRTKPADKVAAAPAAHRGAGEVRIIGGQWKRTPLALASSHPGLRPTPARVRETLFNWLGQDLAGWHCIDAFAGTGALGFEAASRGAASVLICEQSSALVAQIKRVAERLRTTQIRVQRGDGVAALRAVPAASIDLVLIDPPFDSGLFEPALLAALRAVKVGGLAYLEAPEMWSDTLLAERLGAGAPPDRDGDGETWAIERHLRAGAVHAHLLVKRGAPA